MYKYLFVVLLFFSCNGPKKNAQYAQVDEDSKSVPDSCITASEIAKSLTSDLEKEEEKVRALYVWITHNIAYDVVKLRELKELDKLKKADSLVNDSLYKPFEQDLSKILLSRKGICGDYSDIFKEMCTSIGIESYVIPGYTQELDRYKIAEDSHAWNAVKIKDNYFLIDNTWDAGDIDEKREFVYRFKDNYFLVPPQEFIKDHMPFDPIWQFLDNPITNRQFGRKEFLSLKEKGDYNYRDSISEMNSLDDANRNKKKLQRILVSGITNDLIQEEVDYLKSSIWNSDSKPYFDMLGMAHYEIRNAIKKQDVSKIKLWKKKLKKARQGLNSLTIGDTGSNSQVSKEGALFWIKQMETNIKKAGY